MKLGPRTIVTGFGPFLNVSENPSGILAREFSSAHEILEVSFRGVEAFLKQLRHKQFDHLIMLGVAPSRDVLAAETIARNEVCLLPDATGNYWEQTTIDRDAPGVLGTSTCFLSQIGQSCNAGTYLCNYSLFRALQNFHDKQIAFIHLPPFEVLGEEKQFDQLCLSLNPLAAKRTVHHLSGWE